MLFVVFTALMALYAAYSANIVVLLQASSTSIRTLDQLAHSDMTLAFVDLDSSRFVLKVSEVLRILRLISILEDIPF